MKYLEAAKNTLNMSDDELYIDIGIQISSDSFIKLPNDQYHKNAVKWLNERYESIKKAICENELVKQHTEREVILLIAIIADIIAAKFNLTNPATCAALLVRVGISKICI